jgi:type VI secretion system protein ImpD
MEPTATLEGAMPRHDAPARGLRAAVVCGEGPDAGQWQSFLEQEKPAQALALWFGEAFAALASEPERLRALVVRDIAELEVLITRQTNAILHHPRFQKLEASWRGVGMLVQQAAAVDGAKVRLLSVRWAEIARDLDRAAEFDQSQLFSKIYSEEFDMPGGEPYGLLIADYEVAHKPRAGHTVDDISVLQGLGQIAMAAFSPLLVGGAPELFGLQTFREFGLPINLGAAMDQPEYQRFQRLRQMDEARFLGLLVPHVLMREPYAPAHDREIGFPYREDRFGLKLSDMLWGNAAYAYGCVVLRAFARFGWFANIRGTPEDEIGGGMVDCLVQPSFLTDRRGVALRYSTDVSITDKVEKDLDDLGFIALATAKDTPYCVFYGNQSLYQPREMTSAAANANERMSTMIRYMLCVARFAHYIKVMMRDRLGRFETPENIEEQLQQWLMNYVSGSDGGSAEMKARYPLRACEVRVREVPGKPGSFRAVMHLQPHFHLDHVVSSFRLVTEIGAIGTGR